MAEILLTHSYHLRFDPKEFRAMMPYPPLGTLYAASVLRRSGFSVALYDPMFACEVDELRIHLQRHQPSMLVIYDDQFNYLTKMCLSRMRHAAFEMSKIAQEYGCRVIVFSSDASDHVEQYLDHGADIVICGEAEETLGELASNFLRGERSSLDEILGIAYRSKQNLLRTTPRPLVSNLDHLPFPAWDLADLSRYREAWRKKHGYFSINLVTTRGCPFHCNWCAKPIYGQVYHSRSPENVVDEMLYLKSSVHPDHLWFADDIFGLKPGWLGAFDRLVNEHQAHIPFKCLSRVDLLLKEDNIRHLRSAGCRTVWVGAESGSQRILDAMEKGTTVEQIYRATRLLHEAGLEVGFFLQFGYPGETREDIEKTLDMVRECAPDEIGVSVSYPLPGTKFYDRVHAELRTKQNWVDSADLDVMFRGTYPREFYRVLHRVTHKKFRLWQGRTIVREVLRRPFGLNRQALLQLLKLAYHAVTLPRLESALERYLTANGTNVSH